MGRFKVHDKTIAPLVTVLHRNKDHIFLQWLAARAIHFLVSWASHISVVVSQKGVISDLIDMLKRDNALVSKMADAVLKEIASHKDLLWEFEYSLGSTFPADMTRIFNTDKFSDLLIKVEDKEIRCHKVVLYCRCPEFLELAKNQPELTMPADICYSHLFNLLEFIYTADIQPIKERNKGIEVLGEMVKLARHLNLKSILEQLQLFEQTEKRKLEQKEENDKPDVLPKPSKLDFLNALNSSEYYDVVFNVQGEVVLKAHRAVLYARCAHFRHMFDSGMIESKMDTIAIPTEDGSTFLQMLHYLYTDKLLDGVVGEDLALLLFLANAYNIPRLVEICEVNLKDEIDKDNVALFLPLADQHQAKRLLHYCVGVSAKNWKYLKKSQDFMKHVNADLKETVNKMYKFLKKYIPTSTPVDRCL